MSFRKVICIVEATLSQTKSKVSDRELYNMWLTTNKESSLNLSYYIESMSDKEVEDMIAQARIIAESRFKHDKATLSDILEVLNGILESHKSAWDMGDIYMYDTLASDVLMKTKVFEDYIINKILLPQYSEFEKDINSKVVGGKLKLYRMQMFHPRTGMSPEQVAFDYLNHLLNFGGRLGRHWTCERESVYNFEDTLKGNAFDEDDYLIETEVSEANIDWISTLTSRFNFYFGQDAPDDMKENEIVLFKNTPVRILNLSQYDYDEQEFITLDYVPELEEGMKKLRTKIFKV